MWVPYLLWDAVTNLKIVFIVGSSKFNLNNCKINISDVSTSYQNNSQINYGCSSLVGEYRFVEPMARVRFSPAALSKSGKLSNNNDINGGLNMDRVKLTGSVHCCSKE